MGGFIPSGFGQATLIFDIPGPSGPANIVFGYTKNAGLNPDQAAEDIHDAWTAVGSMHTSVDAQASITGVTTLERLAGVLNAGLFNETVAGGTSGGAAPPQVATLFRKVTAQAGRAFRGRMYLPASPSPNEDGTYPGATVTTLNGRAATFFNALATAGLDMVLLHSDPAISPTPVTSLVLVNLVATQRRRVR